MSFGLCRAETLCEELLLLSVVQEAFTDLPVSRALGLEQVRVFLGSPGTVWSRFSMKRYFAIHKSK